MLIKINNLTKIYNPDGNGTRVVALNNISLKVEKGEFIAIMGPSGCGKSTFLNILGCLTKPTSGSYLLENIEIKELTDDELATVRNKKIGFVFQAFHLLPKLNVLANVKLPLIYAQVDEIQQQEIALNTLKAVDLQDRINHLPTQLSGGEQQRVAIARALVNNPDIILADEPTGNLDTKTGVEIMEIFKKLNNQGVTIILVTHEEDIATYARRIINFKDGKIVKDKTI